MTDWCILRTSPSRTLALADSLLAGGFDVWTPRTIRELRVGKKRDLVEQEVAILPEYVFAPASHLAELLGIARSPALNFRVWDKEQKRMVLKGHPYFTVFRPHGQISSLSDRDLAALRQLEASLKAATERRREKAKRKGPAPKFHAGQIVRVDSGGFEGLRLRVAEENPGKFVTLTHPDWMWTVDISAWMLKLVQIEQGQPEQARAPAA